jgi:hypothetical protein
MQSVSTVLIKRRREGSAGKPTNLKNGELAFNEITDTLYYGRGINNDANATDIIPIGGRDIYSITDPVETPASLIGGESTDYFTVPYNLRVLSWTLLSEVTGSVTLDIRTCTYDNYPETRSICNNSLPFISNGVKNRNTDVESWDEYLVQDDILKVIALSADNIDRVTLILKCERF